MTWFQKNGFRVLTENSTGEIWEFGLKLIGKVRLYTNIGTIVAINYSQRGIFVMELSLYPHKDSTIVQVQIYIPCGGFLKGNEWDLDPSRLIGQHARLRGLFYLKDFEK